MTIAEIGTWLGAGVQGSVVGAVFLLALFIGACLVLGVFKLRRTGGRGARNLDELVGTGGLARFLPPDTPRGPIDQLKAGTSGGRAA